MIIVTGTGRCGTGYISRLLTSAGVECAHEGIWRFANWDNAEADIARLSDMPWQANASWLMAPYLDQLEGVTVVHLVRHPKPTVDSFRRIGFFNQRLKDQHWPYSNFAQRHLPDPWRYSTTKMAAAAFYVGWNRMIERKAPDAIRHRVEDDPRGLLDALGLDYDPDALYAATDTNSRDGQVVSDVDLTKLWEPVKSEIAQIATDYGYTIKAAPAGCVACHHPSVRVR